MNMKKKYVLLTICTISALVGIGLGYFVFGPAALSAQEAETEHEIKYADFQKYVPEQEATQVYNPTPPTPLPEPPAEPIEPPPHLFVVTTVDGYIAVYHAASDGKGELIEITSTPTNALPLIEQSRLAQGIRIYTEEALIRILEDYGS